MVIDGLPGGRNPAEEKSGIRGLYERNRILIWVCVLIGFNQLGFGSIVPVVPLYAESFAPLIDFGWSALRSLRVDGQKAIAAPTPELFDLATDPGESTNIAATSAARMQALVQRIGLEGVERRGVVAVVGVEVAAPVADAVVQLRDDVQGIGHAVVALDHREDLRSLLKPIEPDSLSYGEMAAFKSEVVQSLAGVVSAMLLDPEYGAAQAIAAGSLPGNIGLLVTLGAAGYAGDATNRRTVLLENWGVEKIARMGASAVKLRLAYHPQAKNAAKQEALVDEVAAACREADIPLFLEPLSYSLEGKGKTLASAEKRAVVVESARRLSGRPAPN